MKYILYLLFFFENEYLLPLHLLSPGMKIVTLDNTPYPKKFKCQKKRKSKLFTLLFKSIGENIKNCSYILVHITYFQFTLSWNIAGVNFENNCPFLHVKYRSRSLRIFVWLLGIHREKKERKKWKIICFLYMSSEFVNNFPFLQKSFLTDCRL